MLLSGFSTRTEHAYLVNDDFLHCDFGKLHHIHQVFLWSFQCFHICTPYLCVDIKLSHPEFNASLKQHQNTHFWALESCEYIEEIFLPQSTQLWALESMNNIDMFLPQSTHFGTLESMKNRNLSSTSFCPHELISIKSIDVLCCGYFSVLGTFFFMVAQKTVAGKHDLNELHINSWSSMQHK